MNKLQQSKMKNDKNCLLLGMVYSTELRSKRGQEYRDRVRCVALEKKGYKVKTLDNKHSDDLLPLHCTANFSDTRRMMKAMESKWENDCYQHVILDYFFSPVRYIFYVIYNFLIKFNIQLIFILVLYRLVGHVNDGQIHYLQKLSQH